MGALYDEYLTGEYFNLNYPFNFSAELLKNITFMNDVQYLLYKGGNYE